VEFRDCGRPEKGSGPNLPGRTRKLGRPPSLLPPVSPLLFLMLQRILWTVGDREAEGRRRSDGARGREEREREGGGREREREREREGGREK